MYRFNDLFRGVVCVSKLLHIEPKVNCLFKIGLRIHCRAIIIHQRRDIQSPFKRLLNYYVTKKKCNHYVLFSNHGTNNYIGLDILNRSCLHGLCELEFDITGASLSRVLTKEVVARVVPVSNANIRRSTMVARVVHDYFLDLQKNWSESLLAAIRDWGA